MTSTNLLTTKDELDLNQDIGAVETMLGNHKATSFNLVHGIIQCKKGDYLDERGELVGTHTLEVKVDGKTYYVPCRIAVITGIAGTAPQIIKSPRTPQTVSIGSKLILSVEAIGEEPLTFRWSRVSENLTVGTGRTLVFDPFKESDIAIYTITVSNAIGKAEAHFSLYL